MATRGRKGRAEPEGDTPGLGPGCASREDSGIENQGVVSWAPATPVVR